MYKLYTAVEFKVIHKKVFGGRREVLYFLVFSYYKDKMSLSIF